MLAELVGLSAIVVAFIAGVSFEGVRLYRSSLNSNIYEKIREKYLSLFPHDI